MKNSIICLLTLASLVACKKDKDEDTDPNENSTSVGITVYNATLWSASQPYGALAEGVTVSLYTSVAAYPASPTATAVSTSIGMATFTNVAPGEYYVVAEKDYLHEKISNVLYFIPGTGGFTSDSLFQSAPGPQEMPIPLFGAAGNFRYKDLNGDGKIDFNDLEAFPALKITAMENKRTSVKVLLGSLDNRSFVSLPDAAAINAALVSVYGKFSAWHESQAVLDAVYTDEYDCTSLSSRWCTLNSYQAVAHDQSAYKYWSEGFALVSGLGNIIANTELATMSDAEKKLITGQAKALKAYIYQQLTNYFGSLPSQEWLLLRSTAIRVMQSETNSFIEGLLTAAKAELQAANLLTDRNKLSVAACQALLARLYLQQGNFQKAFDLSSSTITDYNFSLGSGTTVFTQANSPEIILNTATQPLGTEVKVTFTKGTILPELRLAEMLLINAEAAVELGQATVAQDRINLLRARAGLADITSTDLSVLRDAVQEEWKREMAREGVRLSSLARWNKTMTVLGPLGFKQYNRYLPIPQIVQNWYFNLQQNPGY